MQKQKENLFLEKFRLLNSQENTDEIIWSLSDSSEYEEPAAIEKFTNHTTKTRMSKRKRKKKLPNNISNLNITVLNTPQDSKEVQRGDASPILVSKHIKSFHQSPILVASQISRHRSISPVLNPKCVQKSLRVTRKNASPKPIDGIKKKLFSQQFDNGTQRTINVITDINSDYANIEGDPTSQSSVSELLDRVKEGNISKAKLELVNKVKSYFNNHFSSESSSQISQSISDIQTQRNNTKTSEEIEILTCKTRTMSTNNSSCIKTNKLENLSVHSSENSVYNLNINKKRIRYKKDGLAYRLQNLLRKQNACLSLWHHERFLAANSNFVLPKEKYTVFRIQKVNFKYGCYLLEAVDLDDDEYLVLINSHYVSDTILCDCIIKVYEPYKVLQYNENTKLLINVCRFECSQYMA